MFSLSLLSFLFCKTYFSSLGGLKLFFLTLVLRQGRRKSLQTVSLFGKVRRHRLFLLYEMFCTRYWLFFVWKSGRKRLLCVHGSLSTSFQDGPGNFLESLKEAQQLVQQEAANLQKELSAWVSMPCVMFAVAVMASTFWTVIWTSRAEFDGFSDGGYVKVFILRLFCL